MYLPTMNHHPPPTHPKKNPSLLHNITSQTSINNKPNTSKTLWLNNSLSFPTKHS